MFNKTTESILSVFTKTIKELEAHSASNYAKAASLRDEVNRLQAKEAETIHEAFKAREAAAKIKGIFDGSAS